MTSPKHLLFLLILLFSKSLIADETFPQPPELQADVDFWVNIFTRYTTDQGVLHDNRNLAVVYEKLDFTAADDRRARQKRIAERRKALQAILQALGAGKRDNLSEAEARVLALWPAGVSNEALKEATGRIRHQQGLRDRFREGLIRAGRWRSFINDEFTALGVPLELAALPHVESSYNPAARSHVGASGIWQFTRSTGRRFMRVDHVLDERNDPFIASRSAGQLLAYNYSLTNNWPMAITAYNHGLGGVLRAMREYGDTAYVDILRKYDGRTFGFASRNFYVAFLAAKEVDQNVEKYFPGIVVDEALDYATLKLDTYLPMTALVNAVGMSERDFALHNPSLQATVLTGNKHLPKGFEVRLPSDLLDAPLEELLALVPATSWQAEQLPDLFHTVNRGDTLSEIAETYKTRVSTLVALNGLSSSNRIRAGQKLRLPAAGPADVPPVLAAAEEPPAEPVVEEPDTAAEEEQIMPFNLAEDAEAPEGEPLQTALLSDPSDYRVADDGTIEVQPLETLGHFADWLEIRTQRLRDLNGFAFRRPVEVGERIRIDLGTVSATDFEERRIDYHRRQQDAFFEKHVITGITEHEIEVGESVWILALRQYDVPVWLFRQYNPELDMNKVRSGMRVKFPVMEAKEE